MVCSSCVIGGPFFGKHWVVDRVPATLLVALAGFTHQEAATALDLPLAIVVERDAKIKAFVPKGYWEVHATFAAKAGTYPGRWFKEDFAKDEENLDAKAERLWTEAEARAIRAKTASTTGLFSARCTRPSSVMV